jgi:hypothetical protein
MKHTTKVQVKMAMWGRGWYTVHMQALDLTDAAEGLTDEYIIKILQTRYPGPEDGLSAVRIIRKYELDPADRGE